MFDLLIHGGTVVDGTGAPRFRADVAVSGEKIARVAEQLPADCARERIDAEGLIVAPGFIDCHSHSDLTVLKGWNAANILEQGVTLEIAGHCGSSLAPVLENLESNVNYIGDPARLAALRGKGGTFRAFAEELAAMGLPANMACFVGHENLRILAMGYDNRTPTAAELDTMKVLLREAMESGALGLSSGLIYPPGSYADTEELEELARVAAAYGGIYASHIRNEGDRVEEAVTEAIQIGRNAELPVLISHHKISGKRNEGKSVQTLRLIQEANDAGQKVFLDQYPYDGGGTSLLSALPPKYYSQGQDALLERLRDPALRAEIRSQMENPDADFQNLIYEAGFDGVLLTSPVKPEVNGQSLAQLSQFTGKNPYDAMFDLLVETRGAVSAIFRIINQWDMEHILRYPHTMAGIDGSHAPDTPAPSDHPRVWATYPRLLGHFCRDKGFYSLEECVHRFTGLPACSLGFSQKGLIGEGKDADLVLFDFETIAGDADYGRAHIRNTGIAQVFVNGVQAVRNGRVTGARSGKLLPRPEQ